MCNSFKKWKKKMILNYNLISIIITFLIILTNCKAENLKSPENEISLNFTSYTNKIVIEESQDPNYKIIDVQCEDPLRHANIRLISKNYTCDKLRPCKIYIVKVQLNKTTTESNQTITWVKNIPTKYAKPEILVDNPVGFNDSIHLTWNSTNIECIKEYSINATSIGSTSSYTLKNDVNDLEIKDLNPCQNYTVQMKCTDINNDTVFYQNFSVETDYSDPGPIKSMKFLYTQNNLTVKVIWEPPDLKFCIHFYDLQWALVKEQNANQSDKYLWHHHNHTDIESNEYQIQNLTGCEKYIFKITTNGDTIDSVNSTFLSPEQIPESIQELKLQSIFSTNVTVEWQIPEKHNSCIREYETEISMENLYNKKIITKQTQILIDNLKPCGTYNFSVKAITLSSYEGKYSNTTFTTKTDKPSQVLNVTTQNYPKEIYVSWKIPEFAELCIKRYRIIAFYDNNENNIENAFDNVTERTTITIKGLKTCTMYTIQINALPDGEIYDIKSETGSSISAPPENIEKKSSTHNSLEIRAFNSDHNNNCQVLFAKFVCTADGDAKIKYGETIADVKGSLGVYTGTIEPLSPYTQYNCKITIFNVAGWSQETSSFFRTSKHYPEMPTNIKVNYTTPNSIHIVWNPPKYPNGNIIMYNFHIQAIRPLFIVPLNRCPPIAINKKTIEVSKTEFIFQDADPYVEYGIQISATNDYGVSDFSKILIVATNASAPFPVTKLDVKVFGPALNEEKYESSALVTWELPCRTYGRISMFTLKFKGGVFSYPNTEFRFTRNYKLSNDPLDTGIEKFTWNETELRPDHTFYVTIIMYIQQGYYSTSEEKYFYTPAGIPRKLNMSGQGLVDAFAAQNPTLTALAKLSNNIFDYNVGRVYYASLLVSQMDCQSRPTLKYGVFNDIYFWPNISNWAAVQSNPQCIQQYQTTPIRWAPINIRDPDAIKKKFFSYVIGADKNCDLNTEEFCNGPLKPGTKYDVVLRLFTGAGYNDVARFSFQTDNEVQLILIIILAATCLCLAFCVGFIYLWVTSRIKWHRESINGMESSNGDISAKNFLLHYSEFSKHDKIQREFKELTVITSDLDLSNYASKSNEPKNRYSNIYPYDKNRVILDSDSEGSDYINASFINGYKKKKEYIATQGPKPDCFIDFWRMILQYNVRVIAMVTEMKEGDTIKCHQYFPYHSSDSLRFGHNITVTCKKEIIHEIYERRELSVKHSGYDIQRNIIHYFFKKWPDHDCPRDPTDLINFIRKVKSEKLPSRSPIVVHCSAGVGRTGTFIGLDIIMQRLKSENRINIFETVKELRFQRMKMVQTLQQYQFLYKCAYQLVKKNFSSRNKHTNSSNNMITNSRTDDTRNNSCSSLNERGLIRQQSQSFDPNEMETSM